MAMVGTERGVARPGGLTAGPVLVVLLGWALAATLFLLNTYPAFVAEGPLDTDVQMRVAEVRDLLAGQAWRDLTQARMNAPDGFEMHWSRLVDAPLAGLVLVFGLFTDRAGAEALAFGLWPVLWIGPFLAVVVAIAVRLGGRGAALPAVVLALAAPPVIGHFRPGGIDHHNIQITLALALAAFLVHAEGRARPAVLAGGVAALMLAIGMETLPHVALAGVGLAVAWALRPGMFRPAAIGFGLAFAAATALLFLATAPSSAFGGRPVCDAISLAYVGLAALGGLGLSLVALASPATALQRFAALGLVAVGAAFFVATVAPHCLAGPYAGLDPRLKTLWFDHVDETRPVWVLAAIEPGLEVVAKFGGPLVALVGGLAILRRAEPDLRWPLGVAIGGLVLGLALAALQVRFAAFSIAFAAPLGGALAARARAAYLETRRLDDLARTVAAWIGPNTVVWTMIGLGVVAPALATSDLGRATAEKEAHREAARACITRAGFAEIAALPAATVLAGTNLGAGLLMHTGHSVLAGHYHRNVEGTLDAIDALMATPEAARAILKRRGVGLVAVCSGDGETAWFRAKAPDGLLARLEDGRAPDWAEPIPTAGPIRMWRVR